MLCCWCVDGHLFRPRRLPTILSLAQRGSLEFCRCRSWCFSNLSRLVSSSSKLAGVKEKDGRTSDFADYNGSSLTTSPQKKGPTDWTYMSDERSDTPGTMSHAVAHLSRSPCHSPSRNRRRQSLGPKSSLSRSLAGKPVAFSPVETGILAHRHPWRLCGVP